MADSAPRKVCIECLDTKPQDADHFYVKRIGKTKIQYWPRCKPCHNSYTWRKHGKAAAAKPFDPTNPLQQRTKAKLCIDCGPTEGEKPISDFYVKERRANATHYTSRCKKCHYKHVYLKDKAQGYRWHGKKQKNGPPRFKARAAIKSGKIKKPDICQRCEMPFPAPLLHAHHEDHSRALDVIFLCRNCHKLVDAESM